MKFKNIIAILIILALVGQCLKKCGWTPSSPSGSSSTSNETRTCTECGTHYSGNGWSTVGGEQFEYENDPGDNVCCSKNCAYNSQPSNWK